MLELKQNVGQRLLQLRKHLSGRLGEDLTQKELAHRCGLERQTVIRLEDGLKGKTESLIILLRFYRQNGYNPSWIIEDNHQDIPMLLPPGKDLIAINETLEEIEKNLTTLIAQRQKFVTQMNRLGLQSSEGDIFPPDGEITLPSGMI